MQLFLSVEAQTPASEKIMKIINELSQKIDFVTNRDLNLENVNNYGTEFSLICIIPTCLSNK